MKSLKNNFLEYSAINKLKINETHSIFVNRVRGESSVSFKLILQSLFGLFKLYAIKKKYKLTK